MFMATKTLTIMKDAYNILLENKIENESFSDVIRRTFSSKKSGKLIKYFGILSDDEAALMRKDLEMIKAANIKIVRNKAK